MKTTILTLIVAVVSTTSIAAFKYESFSDICAKLSSCSSCLSKSYCTWCLHNSKCTKQSCENDSVIYPRQIKALMSGPRFCPRIVRPEGALTFTNGEEQAFVVKLTQIHLYMAFTVWKCKINVDGEESIVNAELRVDEVYCDPVVLSNKSDKPVEGTATVLWDNNKSFDGSLLFKVSL